MSENKVRFGLKNVYYAVLTEGSTNSWATPVAIPGAVTLTLDSNVASNDFYADNVTFYKTFANNGYTGSLEVARIPDSMLTDVWGMTKDATSKIIYEKTGVKPKPFALLFQIDGDQDNELNTLYRVIPGGTPGAGSQTTQESADPTTQSFDLSALPLVTGSTTQQGLIKARSSADTPDATKNAWFTTVQVPAEPTP